MFYLAEKMSEVIEKKLTKVIVSFVKLT